MAEVVPTWGSDAATVSQKHLIRRRAAIISADNAINRIFVSPNGSDTKGTGSRANPFASINKASKVAYDNATIVLLGDRYMSVIAETADGTPLTIKGDTGTETLFAPNNINWIYNSCSFENLRITGSNVNSSSMRSNGSLVSFRNCIIENLTGSDCLFRTLGSCVFENCEFRNNTIKYVVYAPTNPSGKQIVVKNCIFTGNYCSAGVFNVGSSYSYNLSVDNVSGSNNGVVFNMSYISSSLSYMHGLSGNLDSKISYNSGGFRIGEWNTNGTLLIASGVGLRIDGKMRGTNILKFTTEVLPTSGKVAVGAQTGYTITEGDFAAFVSGIDGWHLSLEENNIVWRENQ